jgi:adenylate cyclase
VKNIGIKDDNLDAYLMQARDNADNDLIFANAIRESEASVVLGYFFQTSAEGLEHVDEETVKQHIKNARGSRYVLTRDISGQDQDTSKNVPVLEAIMPQSNIPVIAQSAQHSGYFNIIPDPDGMCRWINLIVRCREKLYAPLSLQALRAYTRRTSTVVMDGWVVAGIEIGRQFPIPTEESGKFLVNYRGGPKTFPHISITDILNHRVPPETFKDKIVLVGATAIGIYDIRATPFSSVYPGPEIHATVIDSILHHDFLYRPNWAVIFDMAAIILIGVSLGLLLPRLRAIHGSVVAIGSLITYIILCQYLFNHRGAWLNIVYPAVVLILTYISLTLYKYLTEERQKKFIRDAFSTYLAPSVVTQIIQSPEKLVLGGEDRVITAFFSDIQGFTSISEKLNPTEIVELLNEFLTEMTDVILSHEGTVDKFEGDAIIAFFGAPNMLKDHAARACKACIDMQKRLVELRAKWKAENRPELKMRIGLSTGSAVVGNMGSKNRMDYTMMGDTVNTAARLEGVNKMYGTYTMISDSTYMPAKDEIFVRELDTVHVVGKEEPVGVYELLGYPGEIDGDLRSLVEQYTQGLAAYRNQSWDEAIDHFSASLSINSLDGPSQTMLNRCRDFKVTPPGTDWDGAFTMTTK